MRTSGQLRVVFGMSCWFMPVGTNEDETERRVGRAITMGSGDEEQKVGEFTAWDPPHRFVAEGHAWGSDAPTVAHEWTVEARAGGTCVVRVVNSYFADTNDWDNQLTDMEGGWRRFFRILQLYMTHFRGQTCSAIHLMAPRPCLSQKCGRRDGLISGRLRYGRPSIRLAHRWATARG